MTRARVEIEYCTQCRWLLRAAWLAQELLTTFEGEIGEVALVPGGGGIFDVRVEGKLIFSRGEHKRFPEVKEVNRSRPPHVPRPAARGSDSRCCREGSSRPSRLPERGRTGPCAHQH